VTAESLLLHYHSSRPGMWPLVVGILRGVAENYFAMDLTVELISSRASGADHETFKISYPNQVGSRRWW
jgi:guanylate cyclase soluble subunit beta